MSFNKIILVGNMGRDPELRYSPQGTPICSFSLATNEKVKEEKVTTWFRVTIFGRQAEVVSQHFVKGDPIYIEGRLRLETYTDRDSKERTSLEVKATDFQFVGGSKEQKAAIAIAAGSEITDADIPF